MAADRNLLRRSAYALAFAAVLTGCGSDDGWTADRAESITRIRGMEVHVLFCREVERRRFACQAGARRRGEAYDTVGIHYTVHALGPDHYELENVRFIGGPGIP